MKKRKLGVLCATLCLGSAFTSPTVFAEDVLTVDPITIEAPLMSFPASGSFVIGGANTQNAPYADSADYLRSVPGVTAGRFGGHGLEPFIRGQSEARINVVSADSYTFGACPNRMDPPTAYMNLSAHDDVTIVRGYQSVLNGFGGTGGSIIIEPGTPDLEDGRHYKGLVGGGYDSNSDMWHSSGTVTSGTTQGYAKAHGSYKDADNYEDGDGNDVRSSFTEESAGLTLGLTPHNTHIHAGFDTHRIEDALFPGAGMDSPLSESQTFKAGLSQDAEGQTLTSFALSGYASLVDHEMNNFTLRPFVAMMPLKVDSESDTYGAKFESAFMVGQTPLETLVEWRRNNRDAERINNNNGLVQSILWPDITIDEIGLAAEASFDLGQATQIIAGGRYDYVNVDYGRANDAAPAAGNRTPNDIYTQFYGRPATSETEHNLGGLLRLEHDASLSTLLYTGASRSVRTADATERGLANFMTTMGQPAGSNSWVGNPEIKPEKHHQLDAGFVVAKSDMAYGGSVYANYVEDYILRDSARSQPGIQVNFPNADIYRNIDAFLAGVELHGTWQFASDWTLEGDMTYTYGEDIDAGRALPQIPPLQGKAGLTWQAMESFAFGSTVRWAMEQTRVDTDPNTATGRDSDKTNGYAVLDLEGRLTAFDPVSLNFGVTNVFDETYASHLNRSNISDPTEIQVNEPGRSFYVQLSIPF